MQTAEAGKTSERRLNSEERESVSRLLYAVEAGRLVRRAWTRHVTAVVLKGPALAVQAWGGVEGRGCTDLDLWVRLSDFPVMREVLEAEGYRGSFRLPSHLDNPLEVHHSLVPPEVVFRNEATGLKVDLHLRLVPWDYAHAVDPGQAWLRLVWVRLEGVDVPTLNPIDMVPYLALHGVRHNWSKPRLLEDFWRYARCNVGPMHWREILRDAEGAGTTRLLAGVIAAAEERFGEMVNDPTRDRLQERSRLLSRLRFGRAGAVERGGRPLPSVVRMHLATWDTRSRGLSSVAKMLFVPYLNDYGSIRLPSGLAPMYYLVRPVRLAWKWGIRRGSA